MDSNNQTKWFTPNKFELGIVFGNKLIVFFTNSPSI